MASKQDNDHSTTLAGPRRRRRKIPLACEPCRERKSRCDGAKPVCSGCQRRSLKLEDCVYTLDNARTASKDDYIKVLHDRIRELEELCSAGRLGPSSDGNNAGPLPNPPDASLSTDSALLTVPQLAKHHRILHLSSSSSPEHAATHAQIKRSPALAVPQAIFRGNATSNGPDITPTCSFRSEEHSSDEGSVNAMGVISSEDNIDSEGHIAPTGPRDYYGSSSAASFIREAFGAMNGQKTSDAAHSSPFMSARLALKPPSLTQTAAFALPPRHVADHLLDVYFRRIHYLHPFFYRPAFEKAYKALWEPATPNADGAEDPFRGVGLGGSPEEGPNSLVFHVALNSIFALGCYSSDLPAEERIKGAENFFFRSREQVGVGFLEQNSLGAVQTLLIKALFLQSTPYPSRCWNAVGVACRLAQGLGLHAEIGMHEGSRTLEREMRLRTWYGCVTLDMLVSMTFGRPTMTTLTSNLPMPLIAEDNPAQIGTGGTMLCHKESATSSRMQFFAESIRLGTVLEQILVRIYQPWKHRTVGSDQHNFSLDTVIELDAQLLDFEKCVPWSLSWLQDGDSPVLPEMEASTLRMQRNVLQSRFLYLRLMLFRPVLSQLATERHSTNKAQPGVASSNRSILSSSFGIECGKSCAQAAIDLIALTHSTYLTDDSGSWWWSGLYASTAGLALIVARSCPAVWVSMENNQFQRTWGQCQEVLAQLSGFSISCRKSLQILLSIQETASTQAEAPQAASHDESANMIPPIFMSAPTDGMAGADMFGFMDLDIMNTAFMSWDGSDLDFSSFPNGM